MGRDARITRGIRTTVLHEPLARPGKGGGEEGGGGRVAM